MILIYTDNINPRLQWITSVFFGDILLSTVELTTDKSFFNNSKLPKINYSHDSFEGALNIEPHALVFENGVRVQKIAHQTGEVPLFFTNDDSFLGFDPLAASFYLLSRYEEYLPHKKDKHGRYKFSNSLAFRHNFIDIPIVDYWGQLVKDKLLLTYPTLKFGKRTFKVIPTMDVDVAYAYKGRSFIRNSRSIAKDLVTLNFNRLKERITIKSGKTDPFDTYTYFDELVDTYNLEKRFFFLLGDYGEYDKNLDYSNPILIDLIQKYANYAGSHPSYAVHDNNIKFLIEKNRLEEITKMPVTRNRFHFLKFQIPETYQKLEELGYQEDYSMAYPEIPGFRTGTCTPYQFYNINKESISQLKIFTTVVMDATCQDYLKLTPQQTRERVRMLIDNVKAVNGTFITLWHNDSISDHGKWNGWKHVLKDILDYAIEGVKD